MIRAAKQLTLTEDQKKKVDDIEKRYRDEMQKLRPQRNADATSAPAGQARPQIDMQAMQDANKKFVEELNAVADSRAEDRAREKDAGNARRPPRWSSWWRDKRSGRPGAASAAPCPAVIRFPLTPSASSGEPKREVRADVARDLPFSYATRGAETSEACNAGTTGTAFWRSMSAAGEYPVAQRNRAAHAVPSGFRHAEQVGARRGGVLPFAHCARAWAGGGSGEASAPCA